MLVHVAVTGEERNDEMRNPKPMDSTARAVLAEVPGFDPERVVVSPLEGGITNRNYRVERDGETFVLRVGGESTHLLGIDRRHEYAMGVIAAQVGVGAEVVGFFEEQDALLTRFVAGDSISSEAAKRPEMMRRVVASRRADEAPSAGSR